ncbi:14 kDa zinc-binding protein [Apostasia shenzhenica]|uniref:14 kDa zinc-binding protein n=1 Tax=Apostasia shenzhenica TaxID=1088818 RepID=A0A2I0B2S6_9ASPA|nr:14 kDa zinc-binding protein [Apostasia shenzhenica]
MAAVLTPPLSIIRYSLRLRSCTPVRNITRPRTFVLQATFLPLRRQRFVRHICASVDEEASAKVAATSAESGGPTIFDKIILKKIPSSIVYEDETVLAFRDVSPQAPVHVLVIPKIKDGLTQLGKAEPRHSEILGHLLFAAKVVAEKEGVVDNFRVVINNGPGACQSVYHLHLHVLGGRQMKWPPG